MADTEFLGRSDFPFLKGLDIERAMSSDSCDDYTVTVLLAHESRERREGYLKASFSGVRGLKVGDLDNLFGLFFEIYPIAGQQLEGLGYRVVEQENRAMEFFCRDYTVELVGGGGRQEPP